MNRGYCLKSEDGAMLKFRSFRTRDSEKRFVWLLYCFSFWLQFVEKLEHVLVDVFCVSPAPG